jgi:hypothetical protein
METSAAREWVRRPTSCGGWASRAPRDEPAGASGQTGEVRPARSERTPSRTCPPMRTWSPSRGRRLHRRMSRRADRSGPARAHTGSDGNDARPTLDEAGWATLRRHLDLVPEHARQGNPDVDSSRHAVGPGLGPADQCLMTCRGPAQIRASGSDSSAPGDHVREGRPGDCHMADAVGKRAHQQVAMFCG